MTLTTRPLQPETMIRTMVASEGTVGYMLEGLLVNLGFRYNPDTNLFEMIQTALDVRKLSEGGYHASVDTMEYVSYTPDEFREFFGDEDVSELVPKAFEDMHFDGADRLPERYPDWVGEKATEPPNTELGEFA